MADLVVKRNDLLPVLTVICRDSIGPEDLSGRTATVTLTNVQTGQLKLDGVAATVRVDPTFTADATTNTLTATDHLLNDDDDVTLKSSGTLPGGSNDRTRYYVISATDNTLQLALQPRGTAIDITSAGTGTHTLLTGRVDYSWTGTDTDTAGTYFAEVETILNGKPLTYPNDRQMLVEIISDLA